MKTKNVNKRNPIGSLNLVRERDFRALNHRVSIIESFLRNPFEIALGKNLFNRFCWALKFGFSRSFNDEQRS